MPTARFPGTSRLLEVSLLGEGTLLLPLPGVPTHLSIPDGTEHRPRDMGCRESEGKQPSEQPAFHPAVRLRGGVGEYKQSSAHADT